MAILYILDAKKSHFPYCQAMVEPPSERQQELRIAAKRLARLERTCGLVGSVPKAIPRLWESALRCTGQLRKVRQVRHECDWTGLSDARHHSHAAAHSSLQPDTKISTKGRRTPACLSLQPFEFLSSIVARLSTTSQWTTRGWKLPTSRPAGQPSIIACPTIFYRNRNLACASSPCQTLEVL
jgi:hypothetical protein